MNNVVKHFHVQESISSQIPLWEAESLISVNYSNTVFRIKVLTGTANIVFQNIKPLLKRLYLPNLVLAVYYKFLKENFVHMYTKHVSFSFHFL